MAESTADVRRDIELTRERMSSTLAALENKLNLTQVVRDNPWPAIGVAFGAGLLLSGSQADVKAAGATALATRGATSRLGPALDDIVANLMGGLGAALQGHVDELVNQVKSAIGAPTDGSGGGNSQRQGFAGMGGSQPQHGAGHTAAAQGGGMAAGSATGGAGDGSPAANPWTTTTGDAGQGGANLTPSNAGSQSMRAD